MLKKLIFSLFLTVLISACYSIKIDKQVAGLDPVEIRQNFFFLGLIGSGEVNLAEQCPRGVAAFDEKITIGNLLVSLITLGIYTPKTVLVNCAN